MVIAHTLEDVCPLRLDAVLRNEDGWDERCCEIEGKKANEKKFPPVMHAVRTKRGKSMELTWA
jgi:hypothetical protein